MKGLKMVKLEPTSKKVTRKIYGSIAVAVLFSVLMAFVGGVIGYFVANAPEIGALAGSALSFIPTPSGVLGIKIGTLTTGAAVVTTFDLQFVPEKLFYVAATQLTGLKVEVLGYGVVVDLDATGLTAQGKHRVVGPVTNGYIIDVADGIIRNKNCRVTITNSAAQTPDIFAMGDNIGTAYIRTNKATVLLNNNTEFSKFAVLFLPSLAATDQVTIVYEDGTSQIALRDELNAVSGFFQNTPAYLIDNLDGRIKSVSVLVAATQTVYVTDYEQA